LNWNWPFTFRPLKAWAFSCPTPIKTIPSRVTR
jgi:hypothetical protein